MIRRLLVSLILFITVLVVNGGVPAATAAADALPSESPDLCVVPITWSPENPTAGDKITFSVIVANQGGDRAAYSKLDCYIDDTLVISAPVEPLDIGANVTVTFTWKAQPGTHSARAVANATGSVMDGDGTNNTATATFSVMAADLVVDNVTWSLETPQSDDKVAFTVTVKNQGNNMAVNSHVDLFIDNVSRGYQVVPNLEPGATANSTFPWISQPGSHEIKAVADVLNQNTELDESNNAKSMTYSILAPDLVIQSITWSPFVPVKNDDVILTATVLNQGKGKSYGSRLGFYLDEVLMTAFISPLAAGSAEGVSFEWTATIGSHTVKAVADIGEENAETDENNNTKTDAIPTPDSDLVVKDIAVSPASPFTGNKVTFTVTVRNQGNSGTGRSRLDFKINTADYSAYFEGIPALSEAKATFTWLAQEGSYDIKTLADAEGIVSEGNETNNFKNMTLAVAKAPTADLVVQNIVRSPDNPAVGDKMTFRVTVKNQGSLRAGSSNLDYYVDDTRVTSAFVEPLNVGANATVTFTWAAKSGAHTIKAIIDKDNKIVEGDEANNEKTDAISISTSANTTVSTPAAQPAAAPATVPPGQKGAVSNQAAKAPLSSTGKKPGLSWWLLGSIALVAAGVGVTTLFLARRREAAKPAPATIK